MNKEIKFVNGPHRRIHHKGQILISNIYQNSTTIYLFSHNITLTSSEKFFFFLSTAGNYTLTGKCIRI